jgi:hypothetical protein
MKLYEITSEINELSNLDLDPSDIADTLQSMEMEFNDKANNIAILNANMSGDIVAIDEQLKRLNGMKKAIATRQEQLKEYLRYNMQESGISSIKCPLFSITLRKAQQVVTITDAELLPDELVKVVTTVTPDKLEIAKALKAGDSVPGATLSDGKQSLTIK